MSGWFLAWLIVLGVVALVWFSRHFEINRAHRTQRLLGSKSYPEAPSADAPKVSVLVAAKDEEENIEACVRTFCTQEYPDYEVIVVDDRSSDRTPAILARLQAEYPDRLRVVTVKRLREGWFGKNNAMREGAAVANGRWYCFADADCRQTSTRTLAAAMAEARTNGVDFLSVLPVLEIRTFWERVIQPVCSAVMIRWYHPQRVNDPKTSEAYANGAFMLIRREVYEALGGHEGVRTQVNEDMCLARLAKSGGHRLQVILNDDLYVTRMYSTLGQCWRGWSRIFYGCLDTPGKLLAALVILTMFSLVPWSSLIASAVGLLSAVGNGSVGGTSGRTSAGWGAIAGLSAVAVVLQQSVMARFYRMVRARPAWSMGYVLGACICWGMLVNAMLKRLGATRTTWRGTTYHGTQVVPPAEPGPLPVAPPRSEELGAHVP